MTAKGAATQTRILDAATRVVATSGYHAVTHRRIAEELGSSVGRIQHHYGAIADLVQAVDEYVLRHFQTVIHKLSQGANTDPLEAFGEQFVALGPHGMTMIDYLAQAVADRKSLATNVFLGLCEARKAHVAHLVETGALSHDADDLQTVIAPVVLRLTTLLLHSHIQRCAGLSLWTPAGARRMDSAATRFLRTADNPTRNGQP
ncbi:TetR/AcrR family transcriptional regulator [Mycobacteroides abscessus]|uniref:TetR/AcrR family transcriptional regulator n=1 Tax=Mycobacteroides abscessus TaxID=36809 RepID=UPI0009CDB88D|nr:TetR/AcrR family transcriptional regulator [Mycobacteroides abscessus]SLJ81174.1 transcriptional regulator [Mycobacteroides abscessus subsp. abscessus]SLJ81246.1 transcriptional regulator [Mycobacteroides abscessus subsp. abscessus]